MKKMCCPFCGGTVSAQRTADGLWYVECEDCGKYPPPMHYNEDSAIANWQIDADSWQVDDVDVRPKADEGAGKVADARPKADTFAIPDEVRKRIHTALSNAIDADMLRA